MTCNAISVYLSLYFLLFILMPAELFAQFEIMRTLEPYESGFTITDKWQFPDDEIMYGASEKAIYRWDGGNWQSMPVTLKEGENLPTFYSLWALNYEDIYAVGESNYGEIYHFDGHCWERMKSGTFNALYDIWGSGPNNIFAVGRHGTILRFDGQYWNAMDSETTEDLTFVNTNSPSDAFAVSSWGKTYLCHQTPPLEIYGLYGVMVEIYI